MDNEPTYDDLIDALEDVVLCIKPLLIKAIQSENRVGQHLEIYEKAQLFLSSARFLKLYPQEAIIEEVAAMETRR